MSIDPLIAIKAVVPGTTTMARRIGRTAHPFLQMEFKTVNILRHLISGRSTQALKARSSYPDVSVIRLGRSPLSRLAWFFGLAR